MTASWFHWLFPASRLPSSEVAVFTSTEADVQFKTGLQYECGEGVDQDYAQAAEYYERAAEQGHALAQYNLAVMYGHGQGVARDEAQSLRWMTRAAQTGNACAQYNIGVRQYLTCRDLKRVGASEERIEALKWVTLAASQGHRGAESACEFMSFGMSMDQVSESQRRTKLPATRL
jgi:TPR repeat protein